MTESPSTVSTTTASPAFDRVVPSDRPLLLKTKALESRTLQSRVPYSIYVHHLNPPPNFGEIGDIFYCLQSRAVYFKGKVDCWVAWEGIYKSERSRERNAQHPLYPKFLLFLSENTHATWQTEDGFRTSCNRLLKRLTAESDAKPTVPYIVQSASFFVDQLWERRSRYPEVFGGKDSPNRPAKRQRTNSQVFATTPVLEALAVHPPIEPLKSVGYADFYRGTRFPFDCPTINWQDRRIILPYATSSSGQNLDALTVQAMMTYPDALSSPQAPIKVINLPPTLSSQLALRTQLIQDIRNALSNRELVLVKGWYCEDPISLANKENVLYHARNTRSCFRGQDMRSRADALLRGEVPEPILLEVGSFVSNMENPKVCQQIKDFSSYTAQIPFFIRDLSDGENALQTTQHLVETVISSSKVRGSTIMSHGGFLSYPNENLSGSCTYTHVMEGRQVVAIYLPRPEDHHEPGSPQAHELLAAPMSRAHHTIPAYTVWLEPGDTLLQPPLVYRTVYNTEESICTQGSFELFDTLHLKLQYLMTMGLAGGTLARSGVSYFGASLEILCRMALSIPYQTPSRTIPVAAMYALTVLIIKADEFQISKIGNDITPGLQMAREIILKWLQNAGVQEAVDVMQGLVLSQEKDCELGSRRVRLQLL